MTDSDTSPDPVPFAALWPFLGIAFGLAWGLFVLFALFPDRVQSIFGPVSARNPLFILAVYAPAIAGLVVVAWHGGLRAVAGLLARLGMWRARLGWIAFLLLGIPAIYVAGALLGGKPAGLTTPLPALSAIAFMLVLGPVEELGWRGVALPLLQRRMAPVWAGLVLGVIWGLWHLPAFFVGGTPQSGWGFGAFFAGAVAVSVILTAFFNRSGGSLLWAALFHFQLNNPLWPDAQPHDTILFVVAAFLVIWMQRGAMFDRREAVTRVLAPAR